jgi:Flp pilus assembly protein TadD
MTSRSLHFGVLGVILGASAAYILAFYRADVAVQGALPPNHPAVASGSNGNVPNSLDGLRKAAEAAPDNAAAWSDYGFALIQARRPDEAAAAWERALRLRPEDADVRGALGAVYWREGRPEDARKHLEAAVKQDPGNILALHVLFLLALETDHDRKKAVDLLTRIEAVDPSYEGLTDLRSRLDPRSAPSAGK